MMSRAIPDYRDEEGREQYWRDVDTKLTTTTENMEWFTTFVSLLSLTVIAFIALQLLISFSLSSSPIPNVWSYDEGLSVTYDPGYEQFVVDYTNPTNDTQTMTVDVTLGEESVDYPLFTRELNSFPAQVTYRPYDPDAVYRFIITIVTDDNEVRRYVKSFTYYGDAVVKEQETGGIFG